MIPSTDINSAVLSTLNLCLCGDVNSMRRGEDDLKQLAFQPDFAQALLQCSLLPSLSQRVFDLTRIYLAALTLKSYIDSNWSSKSDHLANLEPPEKVKTWIKGNILQGLADDISSIRIALAYVVSRIAHIDWPDAWPTLLDDLMIHLKSGQANRVHGAMRVLVEFVRDDISDQQFPAVASILLPELFYIFSNAEIYTARMRAKSVAILRDFIEMIFMVKEEHPEVVGNYLDPLIVMWIGGFQTIMSEEYRAEHIAIKNEVLRTVVKIARGFPKQIMPYMPQLMQLAWEDLQRLSDCYEADYIMMTADLSSVNESCEIDSDGETLGLETILLSLVEFSQLAIRKKALRPMFLGPAVAGGQHSMLKMFILVCLRYMRITTEMELSWTKDMNQYIQDDEEDSLTFNMRTAVEETLTTLLDTYHDETLSALCECTTEIFQKSQNAREKGEAWWWKGIEVGLIALGRAQAEMIDAMNDGRLQYDINGLFSHIVLTSLTAYEYPFLQGRALCFSSQFSEVLPTQLVDQLIQGAVSAIRQENVNFAVRICALKAIRGFCSTVSKKELQSHQAGILQSITALAPFVMEDSLLLLLETMVLVVKIDQDVTDAHTPMISALLTNVLNQGLTDFVMVDVIQDLVAAMATSKISAFQDSMLAYFANSISVDAINTSPETVTSMLLFIDTMLKRVPEPFSPVYVKELFPRIISLVNFSNDSALLQNSEGVIKVLVQRDFPGILEWTDGSVSGLEYIICFVGKLLDPQQTESAAMFVGDLVTKLIQKGQAALAPVLPNLLLSVIRRLESAKRPTFVQTLVLVFAHLIQNQLDVVISFLAECNVNGKDGLSILLHAWCDNFQDFHGIFASKVSCTALAKLISHPCPLLDSIQIRGDLIMPSGTKIITRSQSKNTPDQYTYVSFRCRALQLLLKEYTHQMHFQSRQAKTKPTFVDGHIARETAESDGGDWEDDEGENEDDELNAPFEFSQLNDYLYDDDSGDNLEDADVQADPVYHVDLKVFIESFIRDAAVSNLAALSVLSKSLDETATEQLRAILS
ncbi:hypothetical protein BASA81_009053 [Batrachochytrium salamandrivorans]|nr:hypothetical protein BASA81_009053 [Batrachochytrium salamandrivorans]